VTQGPLSAGTVVPILDDYACGGPTRLRCFIPRTGTLPRKVRAFIDFWFENYPEGGG